MVAFDTRLLKGIETVGIKGMRSILPHNSKYRLKRKPVSIRAFGGERVKNVRYREYAHFKTQLRRPETAKIACSVQSFVMRGGHFT